MGSVPTLMTIPVKIHTVDDFARLSRRAEQHGFPTITSYLQSFVDRAAGVSTQRDQIEQAHAEGLTNTQICERTGITRLQVQTHLQALLLKPHRETRRS